MFYAVAPCGLFSFLLIFLNYANVNLMNIKLMGNGLLSVFTRE